MLHANGRPGVMSVQGLVPPLAGGQSASQPDITLAYGAFLLAEQEQRYGNGEEPPVPVQQLPYDGPPVRFLMSGRQVKFCSSREDVMYHYSMVPQGIGPSYHPVAEYAACLQGPFGSGIVRTRVNITGMAYGCQPITGLVTFHVPYTPLLTAQSAWYAPMSHSALIVGPVRLLNGTLITIIAVGPYHPAHHASCLICLPACVTGHAPTAITAVSIKSTKHRPAMSPFMLQQHKLTHGNVHQQCCWPTG